MSATLGPIHHWLYRKIQIQRQIVSELLIEAKTKYPESTALQKYEIPWSSNLPLEEIIDTSNIHGWLQSQIHQVENSLAKLIAEILATDSNAMDLMKSIFERVGKTVSKVDKTFTVQDIYREIQDSLLDGMPCDRANVILEQSENEVIWQRRICLHEDDYQAVGVDVSVYYELRDALIYGLIASGNAVYEKQSDSVYRLLGGQA